MVLRLFLLRLLVEFFNDNKNYLMPIFLCCVSFHNRTCKTVGITLAWTLASIRVAFASSMQGGLMLSKHGLAALKDRNIDVGALLLSSKDDEVVAEYAAYAFAATGFLFQLYNRMSPPFPLNILLFPFTMAEWALRYGVMKASGH